MIGNLRQVVRKSRQPAYVQPAVLAALVTALLFGTTSVRAAAEMATLDEVLVTAQKRTENVQNVPISISTLSGSQLADQKITNVNAIASQIPNMQLTTPWGDAIPIFSLRGVSAVDYSQNQSSPVALYVDETYKGLPVFTSLQLFDIDRVEVLRGPQGTLYGKNTTGGAVNFYTSGASFTDGVSGYVRAGIGGLNRREVSGAINLPVINDVLVTRVAAQLTKVDGYIRNFHPGGGDQASTNDWAVRWSTKWRPIDGLEANLRVTFTESTPTGNGIIADNIGRAGPGGVGFGTDYLRAGLSFFENDSATTGEQRIRNRSGSLNIKWGIADNLELTSVTSFDSGYWYTLEDSSGTPFSILTGEYVTKAQAWSQDLRLASTGDGPLQWLVGVYGYSDTVTNSGLLRYYYAYASIDNAGVPTCFTDFFTGCAYSNRFRQDRTSYAVYAQGNRKVSDVLSVTAGIRYTKDRNKLPYYHAGVGYPDTNTGVEYLNVFPTITIPPVDHVDSSNVSGKLGIEYRVADQTMLYASVSRGYRGGAFNGAAFFSPDEVTVAAPERVDAFEFGAKTTTFEDRLRVNSAIFYYQYKNQQFINVNANALQVLYNAPKSRLYGAEIEMTARPVSRVDLRLGVSYLNSKYQEIELQGRNLSGNMLIVAPEWTLTAGLDWRLALTSMGSVTLSANSRYTSKQYYDAFNTDAVAQPGYFVHNARLTFAFLKMPLKISAWVNNLADKEYRVYRLDTAAFFNYDYGQRGRPREYGLDAQYSF